MKTSTAFDIKFVFLAYVPPYEEDKRSEIKTSVLSLKKPTKTTDYLFKIFDLAMSDAKIEIIFNSDDKQNNEVRNHVLSITQKDNNAQKSTHAKKLTERLHEVTDGRNGTGLFAIIEGQKGTTTRLVLVRFKGDEGLVNHGRKLLGIDYISEVFTRKSKHYKLAVYEDIISTKSFWKGYSVDRQISGNQYKSISYFWVESFLDSKTALTPAQGTLQFSKIIKNILTRTLNMDEQEELVSGILNLRKKKNIQISVADFCNTYLSESLTSRIKDETNNDDFFNSVFLVDDTIYKKEFGKTVLSIQGGIMAFVPTFQYDKHVTETVEKDGSKNVIIEGKLTAKKINVQPEVKERKMAKPQQRKENKPDKQQKGKRK